MVSAPAPGYVFCVADWVLSGVKSTARNIVAPNGRGAPKCTGYAVYRATVDVEKMRAIPEISWLLEQPNLNLWYVFRFLNVLCERCTRC